MVRAEVRQQTLYKVACVLHWSNSSDFNSSVKSKQLLKEADLLSGRQGRGESAEREGRRRERSSKEEGVG